MEELLKLSKTSDASHKRLSSLFYGLPKIGKTTLTKTIKVDKDEDVFYISADPGQLALRDRSFSMVEPSNGRRDRKFFDAVYSYLSKNGENFDWTVVDGVDEIAEAVLADALQKNRDGRKAYGEMADYTESFLKSVRDLSGMSTIFITHVQPIEEAGQETRYVPMFPGKQLRDKVNAWFDLIGCMRFVTDASGKNERVIQFSPDVDSRYMVGDRSGALDAFEAPDLSVIFSKIHEAGYVTKGSFVPASDRSDAEMEQLLQFASKHMVTASELVSLSNKEFGKSPRKLNDTEMVLLKQKIMEGAN